MLSVNNIRQNFENQENEKSSHIQKDFADTKRVTRARAALDKIDNGGKLDAKGSLKPMLKSLPRSIVNRKPNVEEKQPIPIKSPADYYIESRDFLRERLFSQAGDTSVFISVDEQDAGNDLMMTYYVNEIFDYLCVRELSVLPLKNEFLEKADAKFTPRMRYILVDWIVQVSVKFDLLPETVYLAVAVLDRMFQIKGTHIAKNDLQLYGITALYLACKYEEIYPPDIGDFVFVTDDAFKATEIRRTELTILETLNFYLSIPLPIIFLRRYSRLAELDTSMHSAAKYFLELTMQEYNLCYLPANLRAAAAVTLAIQLFSTLSTDIKESWTIPLQFHSGLKAEDLSETVKIMAEAASRQHADSKFRAIYKKYKEDSAGAISISPQMYSDLIKQIANC